MEEAVAGTFRGDGSDPGTREAQDAAFARLRDLVAKWGTTSPRPPLASTAWWKGALRRALPTGEGEARGFRPLAVPFLGRDLPVLLSAPEGAGPFPAILAALGGPDLRAEAEARYGPLLRDHLLAAMGAGEDLAADPRLLMLALGEAARRFPVDLDRIALDGTGAGEATAAALATDAARQLSTAVLRGDAPVPPPEGNLGLLRVVRESDDARVREALAAIPPRRSADPRGPLAWAAVTGDGWKTWGPWFVVRRYAGFGAGRTVRVEIARDAATNTVTLETANAAEVLLLLNDDGLDLDRPVRVVVNGELLLERKVERSLDVLRAWASQDPTLVVTAELRTEIR
jgi:hypothetical protein